MKPQTNVVQIKVPVTLDSAKVKASSAVVNENAAHLSALVAQQPFFKGLSAQQFKVIADAAMAVNFTPEQWIFRQGEPANRFYLILEGRVVLESEVKEHGMIPIQTLGPGEDLGWAWLFPPYYLHFSARAIEPMKAIFFYGTRLRQHCEEDHDLGYELMKRVAGAVMKNLQSTQQRMAECADASDLFRLGRAQDQKRDSSATSEPRHHSRD